LPRELRRGLHRPLSGAVPLGPRADAPVRLARRRLAAPVRLAGRIGRAGQGEVVSEPLYVEASAFLSRHLTGIGRFVARLVEALAHETPLRLTTTMDRQTARDLDLSTRLSRGHDVPLTPDLLPRTEDVRDWVDRLLELPQERHDPERSRHGPILYTTLR